MDLLPENGIGSTVKLKNSEIMIVQTSKGEEQRASPYWLRQKSKIFVLLHTYITVVIR